MAKLSLGQKADRILRFLLGLRNPYIVVQLKPYGFGPAQLEEGWSLLRALGKGKLDAEPVAATYDAEALRKLDQWENKWFTITSATLARHAPEVEQWFFKNLAQTEGPAVIMSTGTFVQRWQLLDKPAAQGGPKVGGKAAKKLLAERGLTGAVIDEARDLQKKLDAVNGPLPDVEADAQAEADLQNAEKAMWAWYLEWSQVARSVITRRAYLRQLGFLRGGTRGSVEETAGDEETAADEETVEEAGEKSPKKPA